MRAFFANDVEKMHISWAVEGLPTLLHLSLFLFFGGLIIFLYNVDYKVSYWVGSWIVLFSGVYGFITLLPLIRQESPYYSPFSVLAWFLYAGIQYVTFKVLTSIAYSRCSYQSYRRLRDLMRLYRGWMLGGVEKKAEEMAEEQSSKIDVGILDWTINALDEDHSLEKFIEAVPGFFNSKLVKDLREHLPDDLSRRLHFAFREFLGRTLSSNSVIDKVKLHRLDISLTAINFIDVFGVPAILENILTEHWDQVPKTVEMWHTLAPWCTNNDQDIAQYAQAIVAKVLWTVRERDDRWFGLAARVYNLPERDLRDYFTRDDDSGSLALLIHLTRRSFRSDLHYEVLGAFAQIDVRNTLLGLRHDFCTLWNEILHEARNQGYDSTPVRILKEIRHHYIALHQGTDAAPIAFSPSTRPLNSILIQPSSYPLCDIASHRPDYVPLPAPAQPVHSSDASPHHPISGSSTISRQVNKVPILPPPPLHPTTPSEVGDSSQTPTATPAALLVHTNPRPTDASPPSAVAVALQDIPPAATLFYPPEGTTQRDIVAPCTESDITALIESLESCGSGVASTSNPMLPASSVVGFSIHASPPPSRVPPLPNAESLALLSSATRSRSTGNAALPHLRARGLVNTGSMCFANAVLQLLVHSPPFWHLFRELGNLKGPRGAGVPETSDGATPLVDAMLRFLEEFRFKEKEPPLPQEPPQQVAGGNVREDEETKKEINTKDSFEPMYVYHAMKEKRRLKDLLARSRATYRPPVTDLCWPNV